jgi:long-chain acyl-CoA synthetase
MYPGTFAASTPDKPAVIMGSTGETITYRELDERSNQLAQLWWSQGLRPGDHVAILAENHPRYYEVFWAAMRSGLYLTAVNRYLSGDEAGYIVDDCGARALVTTAAMGPLAGEIVALTPKVEQRLCIGAELPGHGRYEDAVAPHPITPLAEQPRGELMLYSSGTTGRPKGIKRPLSGAKVDDQNMIALMFAGLYGMDPGSVYLSPAPLYHSAPLVYSTGVQAVGATVVCMEKFDETEALALIERYGVTHSQWVPTMFVRMLKLPEEARARFDTSSLQVAIHAAAPCPVDVKRAMIDWWGPVLYEYYAGTEGNGMTFISSSDWLEHPGSVGRAVMGTVRICDEDGNELPAGETGLVYFEQPVMPFEYHGDPEKTRSAQNPQHPNWSALGDVGYLDADGFLYLTDRKSFMIISGGVNIYPQEIEDCLIVHPLVADVAVFGLPDPEMGEFVQAVVQPADGVEPSDELAHELREYTRSHIAHYKVPRVIDFRPELPRLPTGKLYKRLLRDEYLATGG